MSHLKFQIVHTVVENGDGPENRYRPRLLAANHEITWWAEHYNRKEDARKAILDLAKMFGRQPKLDYGVLTWRINDTITQSVYVEEIEG